MNRVIVIAEAGANHNGKLKLAYRLIDMAKKCNADFVKFQAFIANRQVIKTAKKAHYQKYTSDPEETQYAMLKRLELTLETHKLLKNHYQY